MSNVIFSFDVGTNSLGSAVVDSENKKILHSGVSIFPMGINLVKGSKEESLNLTRRLKRQGRRQNFRSRMRKELLAKELIKENMFPDINHLYEKYFGDEKLKFREKWEKVIRMTPLPEELQNYFQLNPYEIRHKGAKEEKLSLYEIGRAIYHIAQRRGYKETLQDDSEERGVIYNGDPSIEKSGINETIGLIEKYGTLGSALYNQDPHEVRLRNRYTLRSMYLNEFDLIFRGQQAYHPEVLTEQLYQNLGGVNPSDSYQNGLLFFQRPLRSMKHLIGNCTFETNKPKAPASTFAFEKFRALSSINNIRFENQALDQEDVDILLETLLKAKKKIEFSAIAKKLKKPIEGFNYGPKDSLAASPVHANFLGVFKKKWDRFSEKEKEDLWHLKYWAEDPNWLEEKLEKDYSLSKKEIEDFKKFKMTKDYSNLSRRAISNINLFLERGYSYDKAVLLAGVRRALKEEFFDGLSMVNQARIEDDVIKVARTKEKGTTSIDRVRRLLRENYGLIDKDFKKLYHHSLREDGDGSEKYLPDPSELKNPIVMKALFELKKVFNALVDEFGEPDQVRIELARELKTNKENRAKIRKNQLDREVENDQIKLRLDEYGINHSPSNIQKLKLLNEIEQRAGQAVNPFWPDKVFNIEKSFFTEGSVQIEHIVPYSISMNDSLANKTLCDEETNRIKGNDTPYEYFRKNRPDEWEEIKERIFKILPYQKAKRFISEKNVDADEFISRQLNDTRYISKQAVSYLKKVCKDVQITEGSVVSMLRYYWGLDGILSPYYNLEVEDGEYLAALCEEGNIIAHLVYNPITKKKDGISLAKKGELIHGQVKDNRFYLIKQREDHRHHALDAIVIAFANRSFLQKVSTLLGKGLGKKEIKYDKNYQLELPWDNFRTDVRKKINHLLVFHSQIDKTIKTVKKKIYLPDGNRKVIKGKEIFSEGLAARGQLHEESVFGKHTDSTGKTFFHIRKPIDHVKGFKQWRNIVSPRVKEAIYDRVKELYPEGKLENGKLPEKWTLSDLSKEDQNNVFFTTREDKSRMPMIYLSNNNGSPIPVKKVRTKENISDPLQLKDGINQHVKSGNNHHCLAFENMEGGIEFEFANFWTVVERKKEKDVIFKMPARGKIIKNVFLKNQLFVLGLSDETFEAFLENMEFDQISHYLYRVQKMSPASYYVEFRKHIAAKLNNVNEWKGFASPKAYLELNPISVSIDVLGNIERR
tara:strand:+ start:2619 stop:6260 length:3642 start_codon:yes stop_codon:yes gene_type:complete